MNTIRAVGYYWIKELDKWEVAFWDGTYWLLCGDDDVIINERIPDTKIGPKLEAPK